MEKKTKATGLVVLDTSVFIDFLRKHTPAVDFFRSFISPNPQSVLFSSITQIELLSGRSCNEASVHSGVLQMLASLKGVVVHSRIAVLTGYLRRNYSIDMPDSIIAATALMHNALLYTKNLDDFSMIKNLRVKVPY